MVTCSLWLFLLEGQKWTAFPEEAQIEGETCWELHQTCCIHKDCTICTRCDIVFRYFKLMLKLNKIFFLLKFSLGLFPSIHALRIPYILQYLLNLGMWCQRQWSCPWLRNYTTFLCQLLYRCPIIFETYSHMAKLVCCILVLKLCELSLWLYSVIQ